MTRRGFLGWLLASLGLVAVARVPVPASSPEFPRGTDLTALLAHVEPVPGGLRLGPRRPR